MVRFFPSEEKEYEVTIPIKINFNPKIFTISLRGCAVKLAVQFEPEVLNIGPILPCSDGIEARCQLYNPTNYPIEVYSLEFDHQYIEEDEILRKSEQLDHGLLYLPIREPGQPLADVLYESGLFKSNDSKSTDAGDMLDGKSKPFDNPTSIFIHGAPFSGKTTQAKRLAKKSGLVYIRLDDILDTYKDVLDATPSTPQTIVPVDQTLSSIDQTENATQNAMTEEKLLAVIKTRISRDDCQKYGFVVDGLESKYISNNLSILKTLVKHFADKKNKPVFIHLLMDVPNVHEREIKNILESGSEDSAIFKFKGITDDEYDNLTPEEMDHFDWAVIKYKKRIKEVSERRILERRQWEEGLAHDKKHEDDKSGKKKPVKGGKPAPPASPQKTIPSTVKSDPKSKPAPDLKKIEVKDREVKEGEDVSTRLNNFDLVNAFFNESTYRYK